MMLSIFQCSEVQIRQLASALNNAGVSNVVLVEKNKYSGVAQW